MELWVGCVAGALGDYEYVAKLAKAGFDDIDIEPTRVYSIEDARTFLAGEGLDVDALAKQVDGTFISGFVRATKPCPRVLRPELLQLAHGFLIPCSDRSFQQNDRGVASMRTRAGECQL